MADRTDKADDKPRGPGPQANTPDAGSTEPQDRLSSGDFAEGANGEGWLRDDHGNYGVKDDAHTRDETDLKQPPGERQDERRSDDKARGGRS